MKEKSLQDVHAGIRELYDRAIAAERKKNLDFAIGIMLEVVKKAPGLMKARRKLREYERAAAKTVNGFDKFKSQLVGFLKMGKIKKMIASDPVAAMEMCENILADNLNNPPVLLLLAEAAAKADALFIAIDTLQTLVVFTPANIAHLRKLAEYYREDGQGQEVLKVYQRLAAMNPKDRKIQAELREAANVAATQKNSQHRASIATNGVDLKNDALAIQLAENTLRDVDHAHILIERYNRELEKKDSMETRHKLAEAYYVAGDFDNAIAQLETVAASNSAFDATLDKLIERAYLARYKRETDELQAKVKVDPAVAPQLEAKEKEVMDFRIARAEKRMQVSPNDALLRFDLGVVYVEAGRYDEAVKELEEARRSPQKRTQSLSLLGRCAKAHGDQEGAIKFYDTALPEMIRLDWARFEVMYQRADSLEILGRREEALVGFKDIYKNDTRFRDVGERIAKLSDAEKAPADANEKKS